MHFSAQWTIDWRSVDDPMPLPRNPQHALAEWGRTERALEIRSAKDRPQDFRANDEHWELVSGA